MKRPSNKDSRLEDDDMASLFAAQNVDVPNDLKQSVFEHAERQLSIDAAESTDFTETDNHSTDGSDKPDNIIPIERTQHHRFHSRSRWFAVAATVLIAVAVTPVLLNTPDSSLNSDSVANYDLDPTAPVATAESAALSEPVVTAESADVSEPSALAEYDDVSNQPAVSDAARSAAPASMDAEQTINMDQSADSRTALPSMKSLRQRASNGAIGGAAGDSDNDVSSSSLIAYRQTANKWIEEIQRLIDQKDTVRAKSEYLLFEKQHPDLARDFKPDFLSD